MSDSSKLFLIDGNSLAYRAFFALPETIATSKGVPTNAIFGFSTMLVKALSEYGARATVVAWDAGMSGREVQYAEYKAQRPPKPDLLSQQWPHLYTLVGAFGYQNVRIEDYEADDVIASISELAKAQGIAVTVVTGDRDALQLVDDGNGSAPVEVMTTGRGVSDTKTYDVKAVVERYGVRPDLVTDLIGLKGDSSDNIPGVPGIGDKTAALLLQQFGSLEGVLGSVDQISGPKRKQNLTEFADQARLSKQLAILRRDIDCGIDLDQILSQEPDHAALKKFFKEFELREPMRRLEAVFQENGMLEVDLEVAAVEDAGENSEQAEQIELIIGSAEIAPVELISFLSGSDRGALAVRPLGGQVEWAACRNSDGSVAAGVEQGLPELVEKWGSCPLVAHDFKSIVRACVAPSKISSALPQKLDHDTDIAAFLINPLRRHYDLDFLIEQEDLTVADQASQVANYATVTNQLMARQKKQLAELGLEELFYQIEMPLIPVLCAVEEAGVKLDTERLAQMAADVDGQLVELEQDIYDLAGSEFTIGSPQQLAKVLFEDLGLSPKRRGKTGYSTDAKVLRSIRQEHAIIEKVERWRELSKLKSTYLDALPGWIDQSTGRLHTIFNQVGAATGRISSTDPNLQNIPVRGELGRAIRAAFVAEAGHKLLTVDYSQVELRILAALAGEPVLKEIFESGEDIHSQTAAEVFGLEPEKVGSADREKAKAVNFGIIYGLTAHGLSEQLSIDFAEAQQYIDRYMGRFPAVQKFIADTIERAKNDGYVKTFFGRVREIPELRATQAFRRQLGERLAINTVIQGTAADVIKVAMVNCHNRLREEGLETRLILQIHDELLFESPESELGQATELVVHEMESVFELEPRLLAEAGVGSSWLEAKR